MLLAAGESQKLNHLGSGEMCKKRRKARGRLLRPVRLRTASHSALWQGELLDVDGCLSSCRPLRYTAAARLSGRSLTLRCATHTNSLAAGHGT